MSIATILLIPVEEFIVLYGVWLVGAIGVGGVMILLMIRLRVLGPGEEA